jgi:hypothetical protein
MESPVLKSQPQDREELTTRISDFYMARDKEFVQDKTSYKIVRERLSKDFNTVSPKNGSPFLRGSIESVSDLSKKIAEDKENNTARTPEMYIKSKKLTEKRIWQEKLIHEMIDESHKIPTEFEQVNQYIDQASQSNGQRSSVLDFLSEAKRRELLESSKEKSSVVSIDHLASAPR